MRWRRTGPARGRDGRAGGERAGVSESGDSLDGGSGGESEKASGLGVGEKGSKVGEKVSTSGKGGQQGRQLLQQT